jgi:hypothetical protein
MRNIYIIILSVYTLCANASGTGPSSDLQITITPPTQVILKGQDIQIDIRLKNLSAHRVNCSAYSVNGFSYTDVQVVHDPDGHLVTPNRGSHPELLSGDSSPCSLDGKEMRSWQESMTASMWGFNKLGVYTLQIVRHRPEAPKAPPIYSNIVQVKVVASE